MVPNNSNSKGFGVNDESKQWCHDQYTTWRNLFSLTWGYKTEWKISTTWIRVYNTGSGKGLYQYLSNTKGYEVINTSTYSTIIQHARVGDVTQMAKTSGGDKSHTVIVTSRRDNDIGVTYHTTDRDDVSFKNYFWRDKPLPSDDPNDYAVISFNLNVKSTTIFSVESPYLLMNEYDESSEILVVTQPHPTYYQFDRMSSSKSVFQYSVYAYIAGKSEEEIRSLISSIELQIPYSNKIKKNGNMTLSVNEKYDIKYEGF